MIYEKIQNILTKQYSFYQENYKFPLLDSDLLSKDELLLLVEWVFIRYPDVDGVEFFLKNFSIIEHLKYKDFKHVLNQLIDGKGGNSLLNFFDFTYNYLEIDMFYFSKERILDTSFPYEAVYMFEGLPDNDLGYFLKVLEITDKDVFLARIREVCDRLVKDGAKPVKR